MKAFFSADRRSNVWAFSILFATGAFFSSATVVASTYPVVDGVQQLGTSSFDEGRDVSIDGLNNVYAVGSTTGDLNGPNGGAYDVFLAKYNGSGVPVWIRQYGDAGYDQGLSVSAKESGAVYFSGVHQPPNSGVLGDDAFIGKYDSSGNLQWVRPFATDVIDRGNAVAADGIGSVYLAGSTGGTAPGGRNGNEDAFLNKYDITGALLWSRLLASSNYDSASSVAADGQGNVYLVGETFGNLGGQDAVNLDGFISKFDSNGTNLWTRQYGTADTESINDIAVDQLGNVFVAGSSAGSLAVKGFVQKYDTAGNLQWTRVLSTPLLNRGAGVATDGQGNVFVSAEVILGPSRPPNPTDEDVFVSKFDALGNNLWTLQVGSTKYEQTAGIAADPVGHAYVTGRTLGNFGGPNIGESDAFIVKIGEVPEPTSLSLASLTFTSMIVGWRRTRRSRFNQ